MLEVLFYLTVIDYLNKLIAFTAVSGSFFFFFSLHFMWEFRHVSCGSWGVGSEKVALMMSE